MAEFFLAVVRYALVLAGLSPIPEGRPRFIDRLERINAGRIVRRDTGHADIQGLDGDREPRK